MKEDFDRLQAQLQKRKEKETAVQEAARYYQEERVAKANALNTRGQNALDKVKR